MFPLLILALGCPYVSEADRAEALDSDGDGVVDGRYGGEDCDDGDASIGAPQPYFADGDLDGYGVGDSTTACVWPAGAAGRDGDCDDDNASVHPDAGESCETPGVDDDCDGLVDDNDNDWVDSTAWYPDADGDGWGSAADPVYACEAPAGHGSGGDDCDDADASTHPGAAELPFDEVDNDCNGVVDENALVGSGPFVFHRLGVLSPDLGHGVLGMDLDGNGARDVVLGAPGSATAFGFTGAAIAAGDPNEGTEVSSGEWQLQDGRALAAMEIASGDLDDDGVDDLVFGSTGGDETAGGYYPSVSVVYGPVAQGSIYADVRLEGEGIYSIFGAALATGPVTLGGADALLVGAPQEAEWCGAAYLLLGPLADAGAVSNLVYEGGLGAGGVKFVDPCDTSESVYSRGQLGNAVALLPLTAGDAWPIVAAPAADHRRTDQGAVFIFGDELVAGIPVDLDAGSGRGFAGIASGEYFGTALAAGDVDGSGYADLIVGAMYADGEADDNGAVYVFLDVERRETPWDGAENADVTLLGNDRNEIDNTTNLGASVAILGDVDGDGEVDVAMGGPGELGATGELISILNPLLAR